MTQLTPLQRAAHAAVGIAIGTYIGALALPGTKFAETVHAIVLYTLGAAFFVAVALLLYISTRAAITGKF